MRRLAVIFLLAGCNTATQSVSALDSSCTACHSPSLAHQKAVRTCTDCHGGTELAAAQLSAFVTQKPSYGDLVYQQTMDASHVHPKTGNDVFFPAAGLSGQRGACFNAAVDLDCNAGDPNGLGTVDDAVDSEYARDLNYVRFINPGDLRVAHASCGSGAPGSGNFGGCHSEEVSRVRRSMMATNASVVSAAYLGNRGLAESKPDDPRGYSFALEGPLGADACFRTDTNQYDSACLIAQISYPADELSALDPQNAPGSFEAFPGAIKPVDGTNVGGVARTLLHGGYNPRLGGIGGNPVDGDAHDHLNPPDNLTNATQLGLTDAAALCPGGTPPASTVEPLDGALRGFRAYYPLWLPGSGKNFNAVAGSTLDPTVAAFDPFGRGHGSGCTGCHMLYDNDGKNHDDLAVQQALRAPSTDLVEGANKFNQAMDVRQSPRQQRFYPSKHQLTTKIPTRQCGLCHTFVTRVDLSYQGISEVEEGDLLSRQKATLPGSGDLVFTTPKGTRVRIYDNLERVEDSGQKDDQGNVIFHITTDARVLQQKQLLKAACDSRKLDCTYIFSADFNGNGELDNGEPDFNSGELFLPDRVPRESSVDGRQARIVYGGKNGSTRLQDLHLQKGMHCVDCHFYQDLHGDGNIYTNNWDAVEIECEDCHGFKQKRSFELNPGRLLTSGASGGNDLMKALDDTGRPFFEIRKTNGKQTLWQRSRVEPGVEWQVTQVADVDVSTPNGDPHGDQHIATGPRDPGKLECYSCHNSWGENCLSCHYQQNYKKQQREAFLAGGTQPAKTDFQLFGIVRSPFVLGVDGSVEQNRLSPFRSSMEAHVSIADCNGNTVLANVVHANCRSGQPTAGPGTNNFMPHTVRADVVRGCESCHTVTDAQGRTVNNHLLAQTMGLGSGRLDYLGDWIFAASSGDGRDSVLDVVDVKDESELAGETGAQNSFPGFTVGNTNNMKAKLRSFSLAGVSAAAGAPVDVAFLRSYNSSLCTTEQPLNPDLALVAAGAGGLEIFNVTQPDGKSGNSAVGVAVAAGNFTGVDTAGPDVSDPIVYLADATRGLTTLDLSGLDVSTPQSIDPTRLHLTDGWLAGTPALGVRLTGTTVLVAAGVAGLVTVDVSNPRQPKFIAATPACTSNEPQPCTRSATRVAALGTIAYVATSAGLVTYDLSDAKLPKVLSATGQSRVEDVALSGHLAFVAAGALGVQIFDVTAPAAPIQLLQPQVVDANGVPVSINQAHGVVVGAVPTQTWLFVADGTNGVRAVNVSTLFDPFRGRVGQPAAPISADHNALTLESRDPLMPRDQTVRVDQLPTLTFATRGSAHALARGSSLDRIADESGRRLRDSWNPGNGVLTRAKMDAMRAKVIPLSQLP